MAATERLWPLVAALVLLAPPAHGAHLMPGADAWRHSELRSVRGITLGPIESSLHPGRGYGSEPSARAMAEIRRLGGNWVSITPFGRTWDLESTGVHPVFEQPLDDNRKAIALAIQQARRQGLRVLLVPHLWVETGGWRAEIDPPGEEGWQLWAASYREFLLGWARFARDHEVDMLAVGVELRSWVTTTHAPSFAALIDEVRAVYPGMITYSANWDDVEDTVILGKLDVIGINAFYPLAEEEGAAPATLLNGGRAIAEKVGALARAWNKPVLFTEVGYTTRPDPGVKPWEWPDSMSDVVVDQEAQAEAYWALLAPLLEEPWFVGFFVWRMYADPDDLSQEAEWGFSPRGKLAELVVRDAFSAHWAGDGPRPPGFALWQSPALVPGRY